MPLIRRLGAQIANQLRADILSGRISEGAPLREVELSQQFGTSRGPIRDALQELTKEGMLLPQPRGGVTVAPAASDAVRKLITPLRQTIETYALSLAFDQLTEKDFSHWQDICDQMHLACARQDYATIAEADIGFHRYILERSGEHSLLSIWSTIVAQLRRHYFESCSEYDDLSEYHTEHIGLLKAFRSGDVDVALAALEKHILWPTYRTESRPAPDGVSL